MYLCTKICIIYHLSVIAVFLVYRIMLDQINFQTTLDVGDTLNRTLILLDTSCRPSSQESHMFMDILFAQSEISILLNHFENFLTAVYCLTNFPVGLGSRCSCLLSCPSAQ